LPEGVFFHHMKDARKVLRSAAEKRERGLLSCTGGGRCLYLLLRGEVGKGGEGTQKKNLSFTREKGIGDHFHKGQERREGRGARKKKKKMVSARAWEKSLPSRSRREREEGASRRGNGSSFLSHFVDRCSSSKKKRPEEGIRSTEGGGKKKTTNPSPVSKKNQTGEEQAGERRLIGATSEGKKTAPVRTR